MREIAVVTECVGDFCHARVKRRTTCGECCATCKGGCTLTETVITAKNVCGAMPGDNVVVEIDDKNAAAAALAAYGLPLCAFVAGAAAAYLCGGTQGQCAAAAFVMLGAGFALSRLISHKMPDKFSVCATKIL